MSFPFYRQFDTMDCGPTCLRMVAKHFGANYSLQTLRDLTEINRDGVSLLGISRAAEKIGFSTLPARISIAQLPEIDLPCIVHWRQNHFVVLYKIRKNKFHIADPNNGLITLTEAEFLSNWLGDNRSETGIILMLKTTPDFFRHQDEAQDKLSLGFLVKYLHAYRGIVVQLFLGLFLGCIFQVIAPFLAQSIVDIGINTKNLGFVNIILIAQLALIIGRISIEFIRSWILLHISTRVNISILTDFLIKLMKLPMSFFDTKMTGDIMQRMTDQKRIENFLTGSTLTTLFSALNLVVFSGVLAYYNLVIFGVFLFSSLIYVCWVLSFLSRRRAIDYKKFDISAKNQSNIVQLVAGMQEIKLNNCEQEKRWEWEKLQAGLFKFNVKSLTVSQYQQGGANFINELTNLLITYLSAKAVIQGNLTLGGMVAMQYIVGQLNAPIQQFINFTQSFQDAKISLERLNEIHQMQDEESLNQEWNSTLPLNKSISLQNVTFRYPGAGSKPVLENISLEIPEGKTTAIVGMSGSGKTTILKLLLRFYKPQSGHILVGDQDLSGISFKTWRGECGVVMQEGFIFSDSILKNIVLGRENPDKERLNHAIKVANIEDMINGLPLGLQTKIGAEGNGISQGQKQRILIARAVYKDPAYLFFDEATNALDANNENVIMKNLQGFFRGRTVVIVAHRLSTVSDADNIIVLHKGTIKEQGTHQALTALRGDYYNLVKNQLELGV